VGQFLKYDDKFFMFVNVCWTNMFKVECVFLSFILNATLHVNVLSRVFISLMIYLYSTIVIVFGLLTFIKKTTNSNTPYFFKNALEH